MSDAVWLSPHWLCLDGSCLVCDRILPGCASDLAAVSAGRLDDSNGWAALLAMVFAFYGLAISASSTPLRRCWWMFPMKITAQNWWELSVNADGGILLELSAAAC